MIETNLDDGNIKLNEFDGNAKLIDIVNPTTPEKPAEVASPEGNEILSLPFKATSSPHPTTPVYQQNLDFTSMTPTIVQP